MKNAVIILSLVLIVLGGCGKEIPVQSNEGAESTEPVAAVLEAVDSAEEVAEALSAEVEEVTEAAVGELMELKLELPKPMFVGTPENLSGISNLEPAGKERAAFLVPAGVGLLSGGKPVTSSEMDPFTGSLDMIVDGDKDAADGSVVELGPFEQWVQIDLEDEYEIYAVLFWHYHKTPRVYFDVVVQISNDEEFITDVVTVFNNDVDNSLGLGVGSDMNFIDKAEGKLVDAKGTKGRYVRLYSQGNNQNDYSHYIEVEVFGK